MGKQVRLVSFNYARLERVFFDEDLKKDYRVLEEKPEVAPTVVNCSVVVYISKNRLLDLRTFVRFVNIQNFKTKIIHRDRLTNNASSKELARRLVVLFHINEDWICTIWRESSLICSERARYSLFCTAELKWNLPQLLDDLRQSKNMSNSMTSFPFRWREEGGRRTYR
jgi:hypothetical protein